MPASDSTAAAAASKAQAYLVGENLPLGEVISASRAGLLVKSPHAFAEQAMLRLRLLPAGEAAHGGVEVTAECLYCEPSRFSDLYGIGLAIVTVHSGDLQSVFPGIGKARFGLSA